MVGVAMAPTSTTEYGAMMLRSCGVADVVCMRRLLSGGNGTSLSRGRRWCCRFVVADAASWSAPLLQVGACSILLRYFIRQSCSGARMSCCAVVVETLCASSQISQLHLRFVLLQWRRSMLHHSFAASPGVLQLLYTFRSF